MLIPYLRTETERCHHTYYILPAAYAQEFCAAQHLGTRVICGAQQSRVNRCLDLRQAEHMKCSRADTLRHCAMAH